MAELGVRERERLSADELAFCRLLTGVHGGKKWHIAGRWTGRQHDTLCGQPENRHWRPGWRNLYPGICVKCLAALAPFKRGD